MKTYIERAKDKEIINKILLHIVSSNSEREDEYALMIEESTDGAITKEEFHDWICKFNIGDYTG